MVKTWNIDAIVERKFEGKWCKAKIVGISPANRTLRLLHADNSVEIDVDFDEIRFIDDNNPAKDSNAKTVIDASFAKGDCVERDIDGIWFQATVLDVDINKKRLQLQYGDDSIESDVDFSELRPSERQDCRLSSSKSAFIDDHQVEAKITIQKRTSRKNEGRRISLNTHMSISKHLKAQPQYRLTRSMDEEGSAWCRPDKRKRRTYRRRAKSEDNRLVAVPVVWMRPRFPSDFISSSFSGCIPNPTAQATSAFARSPKDFNCGPDMFAPLAGYCERCCKLTTYRCRRCGISYFCSRDCQRQEWFASHMDTCVSTPFVPLFRKFESSKTTSSAAGSGASSTDGQVRVRYCVTYPEVQLQDRKKSKGEGGNASSSAPDWCYLSDDDLESGARDPPPTYDESSTLSAFEDATWLGANSKDACVGPGIGPYDESYFENKDYIASQETSSRHTVGNLGKRRGRQGMGMTVVQEKAVGNDVINDTAMDRDAAKNLSEALGKSFEDVRLVLKAFKGNAEKTLEWFLAGGEGLPPATDSDDDMPALLIDTDPPHAASPKSVSIENRIEQNKEAYTKLSHGEDDSDAEQAGGEDHTHPNRDNFVIRDDTDSTLEEKQRGQKMVLSDDDNNHVRILFTGVLSLGGRQCHLSLYHNGQSTSNTAAHDNAMRLGTPLSGEVTLELTPLDALVALKTDAVSTESSVLVDSKEVFVEKPLARLRVSILEPENESDDVVDAELRYDFSSHSASSVFGNSSSSSTAPHKIILSRTEAAKLLQCPEAELTNKLLSPEIGKEFIQIICANTKTVLANPFYGAAYGNYVILTYQLYCGNHPNLKFVTQSIRSERVPVFSIDDFTVSSTKLEVNTSTEESKDEFGGSGPTVIPFTSLSDLGSLPGDDVSDESVSQLVEMMAIDRHTAETALRKHKGDISAAVDWIIEGYS